MADFLHKTRGNRGKFAAAYSRGKAALRALDEVGYDHLTKKGVGYTAKKSAGARVITIGEEEPEIEVLINTCVTNSVYALTVLLHGSDRLSTYRAAKAIQLYRDSANGFTLSNTRMSKVNYTFGTKKSSFRPIQFPAYKQDSRYVGDDYYLKREQARHDGLSAMPATKHVGGGVVVFGVIAAREELAAYYANPPSNLSSSERREHRRVYVEGSKIPLVQDNRAAISDVVQMMRTPQFHRPVSGAFGMYRFRPKQALVWEEGITGSAEEVAARKKKYDFMFGYRTVSGRFSTSPFFNEVVAVGAKDGVKAKGYVFAANSWEVAAHKTYPLAGMQPGMAAATQALKVYVGNTKPFSWTEKNLGTFTKYDACPLFAGQPGCMLTLTGVDVGATSKSGETKTTIFSEVNSDGTKITEVFLYEAQLSVAASGTLSWQISTDYGVTWSTVAEPALTNLFSIPKITIRETKSETRDVGTSTATPDAATWVAGKENIGGAVRRAISRAASAMHAEYIGKDADGKHIMALIVPHVGVSGTPPMPAGMPTTGVYKHFYGAQSCAVSRLFIGEVGSMVQTPFPADSWVFGQRFVGSTDTNPQDNENADVYEPNLHVAWNDGAPVEYGGTYNFYHRKNRYDINTEEMPLAHTVAGYALALALDTDGYNYYGYTQHSKRGANNAAGIVNIKTNAHGVNIRPQRQQLCIGNGAMAIPVKHINDLRDNYLLITTDFGATWRLETLPFPKHYMRYVPPFTVLKPRVGNKPAQLLFMAQSERVTNERNEQLVVCDDTFSKVRRKHKDLYSTKLYSTVDSSDAGIAVGIVEGTVIQLVGNLATQAAPVHPAFPGVFDGQ